MIAGCRVRRVDAIMRPGVHAVLHGHGACTGALRRRSLLKRRHLEVGGAPDEQGPAGAVGARSAYPPIEFFGGQSRRTTSDSPGFSYEHASQFAPPPALQLSVNRT